ncbi:MAG TPA: DNA double-strand break repair nuclease NurA [Anaerolineae bacterium]|nr:DNA double-strand break repair nuclease NurA [Anaerolineae bacterium]
MTLELSKVVARVSDMGRSAAQRASARAATALRVRDLLRAHRVDSQLREKVERAVKLRWVGAIPQAEPLDAAIDPPTLPDRITLVAADGSQIYPDRHSVALYYVVNVGSIVLRLGTGETPMTESEPTVCFDDDDLFGEDDYPVPAQVINARRAVAEMARLATIAVEEARLAPTVALADGNIALRVQQEGISARERTRLEHDYIAQLDRLRGARIATASFISRPGATSIVRLMQLAEECTLDTVAEFVKNSKGRPYDGINDTPVFDALLEPGQRSAVFRAAATQWSAPYERAGHAIHFFYLNVGTLAQPNIARVEIPEWAASDSGQLGLAHAALVEQCRVTASAYPYVLTRADELAVITSAEKANFEQMIGVEMLRRGIEARPSDKAATKAFARYGKRR